MEISLETILTVLGVGGILTFLLERRKDIDFKQLEMKQQRYKSCLLFMDAVIEPENTKFLISRHADIQDTKDVMGYLKAEYHEMLLYASKKVVLALKSFMEKPSNETFMVTVLEMRKDLWFKNDSLRLGELLGV